MFTSRGARLKFKASKLWNELPDRLKSITKLATFTKQLKALMKYFYILICNFIGFIGSECLM